eukprot:403374398
MSGIEDQQRQQLIYKQDTFEKQDSKKSSPKRIHSNRLELDNSLFENIESNSKNATSTNIVLSSEMFKFTPTFKDQQKLGNQKGIANLNPFFEKEPDLQVSASLIMQKGNSAATTFYQNRVNQSNNSIKQYQGSGQKSQKKPGFYSNNKSGFGLQGQKPLNNQQMNSSRDAQLKVPKLMFGKEQKNAQIHESLLDQNGRRLSRNTFSAIAGVKDMRMTAIRFFILLLACIVIFAKKAIVAYTVISILGLGIFAYSAQTKNYFLSVIGRGIFGLGSEGQNIWFFTIISVWFYYSEISFASALLGCFGKLGSVFADIFTPISYRSTESIVWSFRISALINLAALIIVLILNHIDRKNDRRRKDLKYLRKTAEAYKANNTSRSHYSINSSKLSSFTPQNQIEEKIKKRVYQKRQIKFKNVKKFSPIFWMICFLSIIEKMTITPFIQNAAELFQASYHLEMQETGTIIAIPFIVFIFLAPFLGIMMDKIGNRGYILIIGFVSLFASQMIFIKLPKCEDNDKCYEGIFPMSLIGMASTIISLTMYPSVNYIVKEKYFGTAFGILQALGNIGSTIGPLIIGDILDQGVSQNPNHHSQVRLSQFSTLHIYLLILSLIGCILAVVMNFYDLNGKNIMNAVVQADDDNFSTDHDSLSSQSSIKSDYDPNLSTLTDQNQQQLRINGSKNKFGKEFYSQELTPGGMHVKNEEVKQSRFDYRDVENIDQIIANKLNKIDRISDSESDKESDSDFSSEDTVNDDLMGNQQQNDGYQRQLPSNKQVFSPQFGMFKIVTTDLKEEQ